MDYQDRLDEVVNNSIEDVKDIFTTFLSALTMYQRGQDTITDINNRASISPKVGGDIHLEPLPIGVVKEFKNYYPDFILEVFQGRLIQKWNDCLNEFFVLLLDLHIEGERLFKELKNPKVSVDFRSATDLVNQIRENSIENFRLSTSFNQRQKIINDALNPDRKSGSDLENIYKHVLLRNAIKHREKKIDLYIIENLGEAGPELEILNEEGEPELFGEGERIQLSIPALYKLRSSMLCVLQLWKRGFND